MLKDLVCAGFMLAAPVFALAQPRSLDLSDPAWKLTGEGTKVETLLGQKALRIRSGLAHRDDVSFEDGTIEFDMALTSHRAFIFVQFRIQGEGEHEEFYFRSHKSGLPDAIQYAPVYKRSGGWQLYHGAGYTAAAELPPNQWIHVKIIIRGPWAAVFVGGVETPQLITPLARKKHSGQFALRGFLPAGGAPEDTYTANFSNIVVRPGVAEFDFPEGGPTEPDAGVVKQWHVSPAFAPPEGAVQELPAEILAGDGWQTLTADASGLVAIGRDVARPAGVRRAAALARIVLRSPGARTERFDFGYSDEVSVFLNGELLFSANDSYSFNLPRRQGLITIDQGSLYLPLREGTNELVLVITDVFGGWGVMGRVPEGEGLEILAR